VGRELNPVGGLFLFSVSQVVLGSDQVLSEFVQQLSDLLDGLEVDVGVQFGQGSDDGFQQGFVGGVLLQLGEDVVVFAFQLGE
jgi:hypothetical protein